VIMLGELAVNRVLDNVAPPHSAWIMAKGFCPWLGSHQRQKIGHLLL